ncbi:HEPN domain-containing protein [Demequina capsici]|uniref:HEPN domain-containing protein n=1 Tax=Demequina capsici TaxID=3075620 RepID=A0AA96FDJ7_9MICO|nr:HEPN domain-containing protein [Demequina sp. PMTSA13]WNM27998.1 HEPN domain-containing protein [Demequina sp. PMTSA13]
MTELSEDISRMLASRRLERVAVNVDHARSVIATAQRHLDTARVLAGTDDVAMAFTAAYDGTRKALAAVLAVHGLRVRPVGGAHRNTGLAAAALMPDSVDEIAEFNWMRQVRNSTEYPEDARPEATSQDVEDAIVAGMAIIQACALIIAAAVDR